MANLFKSIPLRKPKRNFFDLSHEVKTSCNMGELIPIFCEPVVPGDKFKQQTEILVRLAPTLAPIMHRVNVYTHFFFVPNRLIWDKWPEFITKGVNGTLTPEYPVLPVQYLDVGARSLACHFGFPVQNLSDANNGDASKVNSGVAWSAVVDALPFRAYSLIYDCYYRDQNLVPPITQSVADEDGVPEGLTNLPPFASFGSGKETDAAVVRNISKIRMRAWEKDYFTSALPYAQRGEDVKIGINGGDILTRSSMVTDSSTGLMPTGALQVSGGALQSVDSSGARTGVTVISSGNIADANFTINELRRSVRIQEFLEKNARGGSRLIEVIKSHFGVTSSDARLQRPEYLGGGVSPIVISEVLETAEGASGNPVGTMRGHGISAQVTHQYKRYFEEHGLVIGILSIMPKPAYMNGTPRKYLKRDVFDFYWPEFAHIGEQEIQEQEIFTSWNETGAGQSSIDNNANQKRFGYTPRYAEYKFCPSYASGDMAKSLMFWHLARDFTQAPNLNGEFVHSGVPSRIFAVEDLQQLKADSLWIQIYHKVRAKRPMPKFGVPAL